MTGALLVLTRCARQGLTVFLVTGLLAACSRSDSEPWPPAGTVQFGPLTDEPVDFTLTGTVHYQDQLLGERELGLYGFTGVTEYNPVRHALVDLVDENDLVLKTSRVDSQGHFSIAAKAAGLLRIRILTRTDPGTGIKVEVRNTGGEIYAVTRYFVPAPGNLDLGATRISPRSMAGAYNILDLFAAAAEFVREKEGAYPPTLTAYWKPGSSDGTYFNHLDESIHIRGGTRLGAGDTDEYDDDVLLHEYGHFVENIFGNLDSRGGEHRLGDNTQDLRLAFSEGWASFISGTIKKWLRLHPTLADVLSDSTGIDSQYLDTIDTSAALRWDFDVDYANRSTGEDIKHSYASSEAAVAKVLWNITNAFGLEATWRAYRAFSGARLRPVSLETYWDSWLSENPAVDVSSHFGERRANYIADGFEPDDTATASRLLACTGDDEHTLYTVDTTDGDYYTITLSAGVEYTIETKTLTNGADTYLTILDADGQIAKTCAAESGACTNDNAGGQSYVGDKATLNINDGATLASKLLFTPASGGTYYVHVSPAPSPSLAAGRYGSYRIRATPPPEDSCP